MHNAKKIAGLLGGLYLTAEMVSQLVITLLIAVGLLLLIAGFVLYKLTDEH